MLPVLSLAGNRRANTGQMSAGFTESFSVRPNRFFTLTAING
jgi:hypothetical protein